MIHDIVYKVPHRSNNRSKHIFEFRNNKQASRKSITVESGKGKPTVEAIEHEIKTGDDDIDNNPDIKSKEYVFHQNKAPFGIHQIKKGIFGALKKEIEDAIRPIGQFKDEYTKRFIFDGTVFDIKFDKFGHVKRIKVYFCAGYSYGPQTTQGFHASKIHAIIIYLKQLKVSMHQNTCNYNIMYKKG